MTFSPSRQRESTGCKESNLSGQSLTARMSLNPGETAQRAPLQFLPERTIQERQ